MYRKWVLFSIGFMLAMFVSGQEILPKFSAVLKSNGKAIISWKNNYPVVKQISIQRSTDSLKNYTTLLTVPDASVSENGFVDSKVPSNRIYYRLFIVLDSGKYIFTKSLRPVLDTVKQIVETENKDNNDNLLSPKTEKQRIIYSKKEDEKIAIKALGKIKEQPEIALDKIIYIKKQDSLIGQLFQKSIKKFRDSIIYKTKDTLLFKDNDTILIKPFVPKEVYRISSYVFTNKDGNVNISLPNSDKKKYSVKFFEMNGTEIFETKDIKQSLLIVDKTNFIHGGWFRFELFEDGTLKEKNKFLIPKDF